MISQEEKHRTISSGKTSNTSDSINNLAFTVRNDIIKKSGPYNTHSGNGRGQKRERPLCTHYNMLGHTIDKCYKLHGYPPGYKPRQKTQNISTNQISSKEDKDKDSGSGGTCHSSFVNTLFNPKDSWIVDSGASQHIYSNANLFIRIKPIKHGTVCLSNGTHITISMSGDIQLCSSLVLKDVLFVPQFNCNLLSISALIKNTYLIVSFFENHFIIQDPTTKKMIGKGERLQDLYILQMNTKIKNTITPVSVNSISVQIWHNRLGHLSFQRLTDMQSQIPIDVSKCNNAQPCHVCP